MILVMCNIISFILILNNLLFFTLKFFFITNWIFIGLLFCINCIDNLELHKMLKIITHKLVLQLFIRLMIYCSIIC